MTDELKPLTEEELVQVDDWVAECTETDLRHGVRMRRLLDELRRLRREIHTISPSCGTFNFPAVNRLAGTIARPRKAKPIARPTRSGHSPARASRAAK